MEPQGQAPIAQAPAAPTYAPPPVRPSFTPPPPMPPPVAPVSPLRVPPSFVMPPAPQPPAAPVPPPGTPVTPPPMPPPQVPEPPQGGGFSWKMFFIAIGVCIFLLAVMAAVFWWFYRIPPEQVTFTEPPALRVRPEPTLGSELYERSTNPLSSATLDPGASLSDPLDDAYSNPFQ